MIRRRCWWTDASWELCCGLKQTCGSVWDYLLPENQNQVFVFFFSLERSSTAITVRIRTSCLDLTKTKKIQTGHKKCSQCISYSAINTIHNLAFWKSWGTQEEQTAGEGDTGTLKWRRSCHPTRGSRGAAGLRMVEREDNKLRSSAFHGWMGSQGMLDLAFRSIAVSLLFRSDFQQPHQSWDQGSFLPTQKHQPN